MRIDLLGLDLDVAKEILAGEGLSPEVTVTHAPKRTGESRGVLRVVFASDDGAKLTAARFLDPLADSDRKTDEDSE